jgi:hypothetical protein
MEGEGKATARLIGGAVVDHVGCHVFLICVFCKTVILARGTVVVERRSGTGEALRLRQTETAYYAPLILSVIHTTR